MSETEVRSISAPEGVDGERLDSAVARMLGFSRTTVAEMAENGAISINGREVNKSHRVSAGDLIEVVISTVVRVPLEVIATDVPELEIIYEDSDLLIIDKPMGVAAHPSVGWTGPTIVGVLASRGVALSTSGPAERQGIVHRLDVGTTGLMVVAKSENAYSSLKEQFRAREVSKIYHAVVQGHPDPSRGTIDAPINRHPREEFKFAVVADGKPSITHYETVEGFPGATLVEIELETGRTHQIRVHFAALRHPLVGDLMYGADPTLASRLGLTRQWLHAVRLNFTHPASGESVTFTSKYPDDLEAALGLLRVAGTPKR